MKKIKDCTNILVTVLLVFTIIITMFSGFVRFILTDKNMYLNLLGKTDTYLAVKNVFYEKIDSILGDNSTDKLKESIITEDDIKNEADNVLTSLIYDLKSGQANVPQIDTYVYRDRIADALKSLTGYGAGAGNTADLTTSIQSQQTVAVPMNVSYSNYENRIKHNDLIVKDMKNRNADVIMSSIASRAELEAQGRAMLREKGMTEEQARQKLAEKGMSEEQVWDYLKKNGYLDEGESTVDNNENSSSANQSDNQEDSQLHQDNNQDSNTDESSSKTSNSESNSQSKVSDNKMNKIIMPIILDKNKTFDEKMNEVSSKLLDYAQSIIDTEVDKLNFDKLADSQKVKMTLKLTSILYNVFYKCLILMVILIIILLILNKFNLEILMTCMGKSSLISGAILSLIFGSAYLSKLYKRIELGADKTYFEPMFFATADYISKVLFIISIIIFVIGLIMNIFVIKKRITRR
ncbi:MAG: hypothetical protein Q4F66_07880 [Clostridium sp.]|nr:hypothetical protein [Clostridium sp.]